VIVVGDPATGKTSIIKRTITNSFSEVRQAWARARLLCAPPARGRAISLPTGWASSLSLSPPACLPAHSPAAICQAHKPTIGVDFHFRKFDISGVSVALQLWDIAGQDRFGAMYRVYYKDAFGAVLVFDLSREETFTNVLKWKREIDSKVTLPNGKPAVALSPQLLGKWVEKRNKARAAGSSSQ
jgi:Ras-related protein Rab-32